MKPKFLLTALLLCSIGVSAFAQKSKLTDPGEKIIHTSGTFYSLIVEDDISVVLTEGNTNEIIVKGSEDMVKKVRVKLNDGTLSISYLPSNFPPDVKVYVPATFLTRVNVYGKSELTSSSILSNPKLRVVVAGEGKVHLRSVGQITVEGTDEFDFIKAAR